MKTYTVDFHTDADYAIRDFKARSGKDALRKAQAFADQCADELAFTPYDGGRTVNEIVVHDRDGNEAAAWYHDDLRLRLAASEILESLEGQTDAAQAVIDSWDKGDLAGAVGALAEWIVPGREAIAKATGNRS
jgi:hypothetical protein